MTSPGSTAPDGDPAPIKRNGRGHGSRADASLSDGSDAAQGAIGLAACRRRQFEEAARAFAAWTEREPRNAIAWLSLARSQALAGLREETRTSCERALALDARLLRGYLLLDRLATQANNPGLRIAALKRAIELRPEAVSMRLALGAVMLGRIKYQAAMIVAGDALAVAPSDPAVLLLNARCHIALGQLARAKGVLARIDGSRVDGADLARVREEFDARQSRMAEVASAKPALAGRGELAVVPGAPLKLPAPAPAAMPKRQPDRGTPPARQSAETNLAHLPRRTLAAQPVEVPLSLATLVASERQRPRKALLDQILIIRSLILRELRLRYRDSHLGILTELIRPAAVVIVHYWMFYVLHKPMPGQIPIEVYVLAGFATWFAFNGTWSGAATGSKWPGGATLLPGVTDLHLRVAKAGWQFLLNLVFCLLALLPMRFFGSNIVVPDVPQTCLIFTIAGTMGFGLGLVLERLGRLAPLMKTAEKLLTWGLFITSGLYFSLATTPEVVADWFWYNPMLHLIEFERNAFYPGYPVALLDLRYPAVVAVGLLLTGILMHKAIRVPDHE